MSIFSRKAIMLALMIAALLSACGDNFHPRDTEHPEWQEVYKKYGIDSACFEVMDNSHDRVLYYNLARSSARMVPASTFKIFIALVALETGIAPDESLVIPWDGHLYDIKSWNQDLDLKQAMITSSEPYFRELIKRIGRPTMQAFLDSNQYGNMKIGKVLEDCWHDGSLLISPDEQVGFINHLYHGNLSFSQRTHRIVRRLLSTEDSLSRQQLPYKITYKTGLHVQDSTYLCWQVGYMEDSVNNAHPYFFANNFEISKELPLDSVLRLRLQTTRDIFARIGVL